MKKIITKLITFLLLIALCFNTFACGNSSANTPFDDPFVNEGDDFNSEDVNKPFVDPFERTEGEIPEDKPFVDPFGTTPDVTPDNPFTEPEVCPQIAVYNNNKSEKLGEEVSYELGSGKDFNVVYGSEYTVTAVLTKPDSSTENLTISNGKFTFTPSVAGNYTLRITAKDSADPTKAVSTNVTIIVSANAHSITLNTTTAQIRTYEDFNLVLGTDFTVDPAGSYTYTAQLVYEQESPTALTFNSNKFTFKPTKAGNYYVQITARDGSGVEAKSGTITIKAIKKNPVINLVNTTINATIDSTFNYVLGTDFTVTHDRAYTLSAQLVIDGGQPINLPFSDNKFSYNVTKAGMYSLQIKATDNKDASEFTTTNTLSFSVAGKPSDSVVLTIPNATPEWDVGGTFNYRNGLDYVVTCAGEYTLSATVKAPGSSSAQALTLENNDIVLPISQSGTYTVNLTATSKADTSNSTTETIAINAVKSSDYDSTPVLPTDYKPLSTTYGATAAQYNGSKKTISQVKTLNGKTYLDVNGSAFPYLGTQIRTDMFMNVHNYTYSEIKVLFNEAKKLGVTCVQIPLEWTDIENEKDQWDFTYIDQIMSMCLEYGLKLEFLWFGTNMCGDTHSYSTPSYILRDGKTYPKLDARRTGEFWSYYGFMYFMDFSNDNLIAREANAITQSMNHIYEFDSTHGGTGIVIGMQILNEANMFFGYDSRLDKNMVIDPLTGNKMTFERGLSMVKKSLNALGLAVKNSKYVVYTRTNFANGTDNNVYSNTSGYQWQNVNSIGDWAAQIYNLEGIDAVGDDTYNNDVNTIKGVAYMYRNKNLAGNFSHFAENAGNYENTWALIVAAFAAGAGYSIYDLVTPDVVDNKQGIIELTGRATVSYPSRYGWTQKVIKGIASCGEAAALATEGNFAMFTSNKTINLGKATVQFSGFGSGFIGFAIAHGNKAYIYCVNSGTAIVNGTSYSVSADSVKVINITERNQDNNVWGNIG